MKNTSGCHIVLVLSAFFSIMFSAAVTCAMEGSLDGSIRVLDLDAAQRIALEQNPSVDAAVERVRQARERITQAKSAYWPRLDASAGMARVELSRNALEDPFSGGRFGVDSPEDYYTADLAASWIVFDGFERKFNTSAATFGKLESEASLRETRRLILSAVAEAYYRALLARENIRIAEADQTFNRKQVEDARARLRVGTGPLSDVLNFEVQINTARSNLIAAKNSHQVALYALAALMGVPEARFDPDMRLDALKEETPDELDAPESAPLLEAAETLRPDVLQSEYAVKRNEDQIGIAESDFYPVVQLTGVLEGERPGNGRMAVDDFGNAVALSLSYNLFSGGLHRARLSEARHGMKEAEKIRENTLISAKSEVLEALAGLHSAQEQLVLQRSNAELVRQNRDLVEKEYAAGQTSLVRLNEAQRDLIGAEARLALARVSLRLAWQDLKAATGQILTPFDNPGEKGL